MSDEDTRLVPRYPDATPATPKPCGACEGKGWTRRRINETNTVVDFCPVCRGTRYVQ